MKKRGEIPSTKIGTEIDEIEVEAEVGIEIYEIEAEVEAEVGIEIYEIEAEVEVGIETETETEKDKTFFVKIKKNIF